MKKIVITFISIFLISSCSKNAPEISSEKEVILKNDDVILSTVNNSSISQFDLDFAISKLVPKEQIGTLSKSDKEKFLESLVSSKALSMAEEKLMTNEDRKKLEKEVAYFREELLVKKYITRKAKLEVLPEKTIKEFYDTHPDKFGGKTLKTYELIKSTRELKTKERDTMIETLKASHSEQNWEKWVKKLKKRGYPVSYGKGEISEKLLHPRLRDSMAPLKQGEASNVIFIKGVLYLVKIEKEEAIPPRPLSEVRAQIRKMLSPILVKKELKKLSQEAKQKAEIKYLRDMRHET